MASIPFSYECSTAAGFLPDPATRQRVGYLTALTIGTTEYPKDLGVFAPALAEPAAFTGLGSVAPAAGNEGLSQINVVGVLENFEWDGAAGHPVKLEFHVSQENATQLKASQQSTLTTANIKSLAWWIVDYDQETKVWYEQSFPVNAVSGVVPGAKDNPALDVDLTGAPVKDGIDVLVYKVSISVAPAANAQYTLRFANSSRANMSKSWGLVVSQLH
ncbi:MAG TPA: hypothetical protein VJ914_22425 [Pseudonocardiaceae bacterium]|nr:hypothetical protein [Pseudonocardiaceae bacterium]